MIKVHTNLFDGSAQLGAPLLLSCLLTPAEHQLSG